jgi:transposase InsO family protein
VETRLRIIKQVENGDLRVKKACELLGLSRPGLWKIRNRVREQGYTQRAVIGNKRGPKTYNRVWNRTPEHIEDRVVELRQKHGVGPDRLGWLLEDEDIYLHRSTIYRILVRRGVHRPKEKERKRHNQLYRKGYPGEEVQMDTTEPFGKGGPILISAIDDYSRWGFGDLYHGNTSKNAGVFLRKCVFDAPFAIQAVRVDRGSEFHKDFIKTCEGLGINIIRNPTRTPRKNGKVERFHRTIEEECLWRVSATGDNLPEAKYWLNRYLAWYNHKRHHGGYGMGGQTPHQQLTESLREQLIYQEVENVNETVILYKT